MFNGYEYMRQVTVQSVGIGGVVDENGRSLKVIGNMPIQPGDTVWTDGRIVYGHRPVRPNVKPPTQKSGIPFFCIGKSRQGGYITADGNVKIIDTVSTFNYLHTWLYTDPDKIYYEYFYKQGVGTDFYLDMLCTDDVVLTAEVTNLDEPYNGYPNADMSGMMGQKYNDVAFLAINMIYLQNEKSFSLSKFGSSKVYSNPRITIKKNGNVIGSFLLTDYLFAVEKIQEIYLGYDSYEEEAEKRYTWTGGVEGDPLFGVACDVFVGSTVVQVLNFHFTDTAGAWEMIILSLADGSCAPHTIDQEYDEEKEDFVTVYSHFSFLVPLVYQVWRVNSKGKKVLLQQWISIKPIPNNGVNNKYWAHAKAFPVARVNESVLPPFDVNYGDYVVNTNLQIINHIADKKGNTIARILPLESFTELYISNPDGDLPAGKSMGSTNQFLTINFRTGAQTISSAWTHTFGYCPENSGCGAIQVVGEEHINLGPGHPSYFGRLCVYPLDDKKSIVSLYLQDLWIIEKGQVIKTLPYSLNQNLCYMPRLKGLKNKTISAVPGMTGLVESRTKNDDND